MANDWDPKTMQKKLTCSKFSPFKDMVHAIAKAGSLHGAGNPLELAHNSVQGARFRFAEPEALPDAFFVTRDVSRPVVIEDISVAGDYTPLADVCAAEQVCLRNH